MFFNNKRILQQTYDNIDKLNRNELYKICNDFDFLVCYAVQSSETPNKRIPLDKRKYGCVTYSDAAKLYNTAVERYNSLLEKERNS